MNFWRASAIGGLVLLAVVGLAIEFAVFLKANHDERMFHEEQRQQKEQAELERECELAFPRSPANQLKCLEKSL